VVDAVVDLEFYQMQGLASSTDELSDSGDGLHFVVLAHQSLSQLSSQPASKSVSQSVSWVVRLVN
jgi:hypothetical protein